MRATMRGDCGRTIISTSEIAGRPTGWAIFDILTQWIVGQFLGCFNADVYCYLDTIVMSALT